MTETEAPSAHHGGVANFYRKAEHFSIEELCLHDPNTTRFQLVTGQWRWYIVECYIYHNDESTIDDVAAATRDQSYRDNLLLAGEFNINLADLEVTPWLEAISDELAAAGLMDMRLHFLPQSDLWL